MVAPWGLFIWAQMVAQMGRQTHGRASWAIFAQMGTLNRWSRLLGYFRRRRPYHVRAVNEKTIETIETQADTGDFRRRTDGQMRRRAHGRALGAQS